MKLGNVYVFRLHVIENRRKPWERILHQLKYNFLNNQFEKSSL